MFFLKRLFKIVEGIQHRFFGFPVIIDIRVVGNPKIASVLESVEKKNFDGEFEFVGILIAIKFSKYR